MPVQRPHHSKSRQSRLASRMASDFEAVPLHNTVHDTISEDKQLAQVLDAAAEAKHAAQRREEELGEDNDYQNIRTSEGTLSQVADRRAREVVAETCATVIQDGDAWVDEGIFAQPSVDDAKQEARQWLKRHTNPADRAGVLEEVTV